MSDDVLFRQAEGPLFTRVDDDLMGVNTQGGLVYTLNGSGARIWELLQDWTTLEAVCAQLQREYAVEPDRCAAHVRSLVDRLREEGLVEQRQNESS